MAEEVIPAATDTTPAAPVVPVVPPADPATPAPTLIAKPEDAPADPAAKTEDTPADKPEEKPKDTDKPEVPETYEFKAPEGLTLDPAALEAFTPVLKELGASQEVAQKLVDLHAQALNGFAKAQQDAWVKQQETWAGEFNADKEFGGQNAEASLRSANTAWSKFATKEEIAQIHSFGLANFPPLVKVLARVGKLMGEDAFHQGGTGSTDTKSVAEKFYPGMNP
jgi:hypothetical protein